MKSKFFISAFIVLITIVVVVVLYSIVNKENKSAKLQVPVIERDFDIIYGYDEAPIQIFMYSCYSCSFCRKFLKEDFPKLEENFINTGKLRFNIKLINLAQNANMNHALKTVVCLKEFGNFEKVHELLLLEPTVVHSDKFYNVINELINKNEFIAECMLSGSSENYLLSNYGEFKSNKLKGTPTFIINNRIYKGYKPYVFFEELIKKQLSQSNN